MALQVVGDALRGLTDRQRQAVVLRHFLGLSAGEVAVVLGATEEAVRALTMRGVAALRASLPAAIGSEAIDGE